jgi:hypothetical protein
MAINDKYKLPEYLLWKPKDCYQQSFHLSHPCRYEHDFSTEVFFANNNEVTDSSRCF